MIERVADPLDESERQPRPGTLRVSFDTKALMQRAGIPSDMSERAHERYVEYLSALSEQLPEAARIRATGYRYGPAAGDADLAFIDLIIQGAQLAQAAQVLITAVRWLRDVGALEIRISDEAAEILGLWELDRRGVTGAALVSRQLVRSPRGTGAKYDGFVLVYRLPDSAFATVSLSVEGILQQLSIPNELHRPSAVVAAADAGVDRPRLSGANLETEYPRMARTGDTRRFDARQMPTGALSSLGNKFATIFEGPVHYDITRTTVASDDQVSEITDLAKERAKIHIALDAPRTPTITIEGSDDVLVISVTGTGGAQFDLIYGLVRETLGLGDERRPTGPYADPDV
jgi:hypothetical protein